MYGLLTPTDITGLEFCLDEICKRFPNENLNILEIGVCHGDTSRGINEYLTKTKERKINFTGIDNNRDKIVQVPFEGAKMYYGDSAEIYMIPNSGFHFILIDGCHCSNHIILDFSNYGEYLISNGLIMFHDANPKSQQKMDYQGHGSKTSTDFGTATLSALRKLNLFPINKRKDWTLFDYRYDDNNWGGVIIYERNSHAGS